MRRLAAALTISLVSFTAFAQKPSKSDLLVNLKFTPQESVDVESVALPPSLLERSVDIRWSDGRKQEDASVIGSGTDDDDKLFSVRASTDVVEFVSNTVGQAAEVQGLKKASPADRQLDISLSRFTVSESNKALGSTYSAEVHLAYTLKDAAGVKLTEGAASGTANRYGKARSGANMSEVLSDALKEAFTGVLEDSSLKTSWISGKPAAGAGSPSTAAPAAREGTVEERLKKLDDLLAKGLITKEEHKAARARILEEM